MLVVVQRVTDAWVNVAGNTVGSIGKGLREVLDRRAVPRRASVRLSTTGRNDSVRTDA